MRLIRTAAWVCLCSAASCLVSMMAVGQSPQAMVPKAGLPPLRSVTTAEYRAHLDALRQLVADCSRVVTACDATKVGDDDKVQPAAGPAYTERYGWLRTLLEDRNDTNHPLRLELLPHAEQRLIEQQAELERPQSAASVTTAAQRSARAAVLRRSEFRTDRGYSFSERISAWIEQQLARLFGGVSSLGRAAPWLGTTLEWSALIGVLALLLVWVYRALDRQRVALGRLSGDAARQAALADSRVWADKARQHAERAEWRDAVHALYWASIVVLEDRRTLRRSAMRTPREALKLVDAKSPLGSLLGAQTSAFERIWYGLQPADAADYESAMQQYQAMQNARTQAAA